MWRKAPRNNHNNNTSNNKNKYNKYNKNKNNKREPEQHQHGDEKETPPPHARTLAHPHARTRGRTRRRCRPRRTRRALWGRPQRRRQRGGRGRAASAAPTPRARRHARGWTCCPPGPRVPSWQTCSTGSSCGDGCLESRARTARAEHANAFVSCADTPQSSGRLRGGRGRHVSVRGGGGGVLHAQNNRDDFHALKHTHAHKHPCTLTHAHAHSRTHARNAHCVVIGTDTSVPFGSVYTESTSYPVKATGTPS